MNPCKPIPILKGIPRKSYGWSFPCLAYAVKDLKYDIGLKDVQLIIEAEISPRRFF
jgi:hypothetical protein